MNVSFKMAAPGHAVATDELRSIIDTIPVQVWRSRADGAAQFFNQCWLDYTGCSLEKGLGFGWHETVHPADLSGLLECWQGAINSIGPKEREARLRRFDGQYRRFLFRAVPVRSDDGSVQWYGTNIDIDDQRLIEDRIRRGEEELQLAIDSIPVSAWRADPNGDMNFFNEQWRAYTGLAIVDATGWRWAEQGLFHPDDVQAIVDNWRVALAKRKAGVVEARMRRFDGEYRWHMIRGHPLLDGLGNVIQWYGTNTDLEDRKIAEQALQKTQSQLAYVTRVTTLNEMVASIAHEVNQPLSAVITNAQAGLRWLAKDAAGLDEVRSALQRIVADADRASAVIHGIRELSTKVDPIFTALDVNDVVREVVRLMGHEIVSHGVSLSTNLEKGNLVAVGDRVQVQQVLINLMMNGMESMSTISTRPRLLTISTAREDSGNVLISVQDAGLGLDANDTHRLFEAFYSSKPQGMGMGLAISRSIIEAHGGRITAANNSDHGATFRISLKADSTR
jgi:PAS domain S-box-containing protein